MTFFIIIGKLVATLLVVGLVGMGANLDGADSKWFNRFELVVCSAFLLTFGAAVIALWFFVPNGLEVE